MFQYGQKLPYIIHIAVFLPELPVLFFHELMEAPHCWCAHRAMKLQCFCAYLYLCTECQHTCTVRMYIISDKFPPPSLCHQLSLKRQSYWASAFTYTGKYPAFCANAACGTTSHAGSPELPSAPSAQPLVSSSWGTDLCTCL